MDSDNGLLNSARKMNPEALIKIFDLYSRTLYNYALRLCSDPYLADQIVGDVFAKLLEQFSSGYGPQTNLRSYLYEVTYHLVVDYVRHRKREIPIQVMDEIGFENHATYFDAEKHAIYMDVMRAIRDELTEDQRHVIILRFMEGFDLRETAAIIGKQVSNVKVIQNRAVATLRKSLNYAMV